MEPQRERLHFTTSRGPLGELDIDADMTMGDLLLQLLLRFGKRPPLRLVRGTDVVHFAIGDRVMQVLRPLLQAGLDGGEQERVDLTLVALVPNEVRAEKREIEGFQKIQDSQWLWGGARKKGNGGGEDGSKGGGISKDEALLKAWVHDAARNSQRASLDAFPFSALMGASADIDFRYEQRQISCKLGAFREDKVVKESILYSAAMKGNETFVRLLIECRAEVGDRQAYDFYEPGHNAQQIKETVLYAAVINGNANICRLLLEAKACANHGLTEYNGERPWEMQEKTITPLNVAAQKGDAAVCRMLLDYRADPNDGFAAAWSQGGTRPGSVWWPKPRRVPPANVAKSQQCEDLLSKASKQPWCCSADWRGWLCETCGTQR